MRTGATTAALVRPTASVGRLAELVAHLAGCSGEVAVEAVHRAMSDPTAEVSAEERLAIVARALLGIRHDPAARPRRAQPGLSEAPRRP